MILRLILIVAVLVSLIISDNEDVYHKVLIKISTNHESITESYTFLKLINLFAVTGKLHTYVVLNCPNLSYLIQ